MKGNRVNVDLSEWWPIAQIELPTPQGKYMDHVRYTHAEVLFSKEKCSAVKADIATYLYQAKKVVDDEYRVSFNYLALQAYLESLLAKEGTITNGEWFTK